MIRCLSVTDYSKFLTLTRCKQSKRETSLIDEAAVERLLTRPGNVVIGYFENDDLITAVAVRFGELHGENIWAIAHMFTSRPSNVFSFSRPDFGEIIKTFFEMAESQRVYSYIYAIPANLSSVYYKKWKTNPYLPPTGRYNVSVILTIPAHTVPQEKWAAGLIGGSKPYDIVVNSRSLKPEFRT